MTQVTQVTQGAGGNTSTPAPNPRGRKWCFTLNNYTEEEYDTLTQVLSEKGKVIIGKEKGEEGTPHLQGYIECKNAIYFNSLKKLMPRAHIEKAKGTLEQNVAYCSKEGDTFANFEQELTYEQEYEQHMLSVYKNVVWKDWQYPILDIIESTPNERTVHWYWEPIGNKGKSFLAKYIDWKYNAIIASGKQLDIFNQYKLYIEENKKCPRVALIDVPRSHKDYVCYSTMEKIKDGLLYSGKYEGGKIRLIPHHLIVFANFPPDKTKMSEDRWNIVEIV